MHRSNTYTENESKEKKEINLQIMAEAVLAFALKKLADFIAGKLGDYVTGKLNAISKVRSDAEWMRAELGYMKSFLKDAERKQEADERVNHWISDVRGIANDTVSVLENLRPTDSSWLGSVQFYACVCSNGTNTFDIGEEIGLLKGRVEEIAVRRQRYGIININLAQSSTALAVKEMRRTTSFTDAAQLFVGLEDAKHELLDALLTGDPHRCVVSIHGMGGLGKTTLARNLYHSTELYERFSDRAWVCVSQEYNIQELLRTVIKSFKKVCSHEELTMLEKMDVEDLERYLHNTLKDRPYLVVVDDIWEKEAWESLKRAFPDSSNGSRVIATTRNKDVATRMDERVYAHHLRHLDSTESWNLFMTRLSIGQADRYPSPAMQELGRAMVAKCRGLPLAIVVLGGLLAQKRNLEAWEMVKEDMWNHLENETDGITHLLSLSYNDLSSELKQCFLYVGTYPEDYLINAQELKCLWIGEGFITPGDHDMEEVAGRYLDELISRNLIQATKIHWEIVDSCRVHDLILDLAVKKAQELEFFGIYHPDKEHSSLAEQQRHIVYTQTERYLSLIHLPNSRLRALVLLDLDSTPPKTPVSSLPRYNHLCVLKLVNVSFENDMLPETVGHLIQLKVFVVLKTVLGSLPPSIGNLNRLEILVVENGEMQQIELPPEISKLTNLRQLITRVRGEANIGALSNLCVLKTVEYVCWRSINHVNLVNIQELVIEHAFEEEGKPNALEPISKLKRLHTLVLSCRRKRVGKRRWTFYHFPPLNFLSSCSSLRKLWLQGGIEVLLPAENLPKSITVLRLSESNLVEDPIPTLSKLPNLRRLDLNKLDIPDGTMFVGSGCFPELEILSLCDLPNMTGILLAEGALPKIKHVYMSHMLQEHHLPERLKPIVAQATDEYTVGEVEDCFPRAKSW